MNINLKFQRYLPLAFVCAVAVGLWFFAKSGDPASGKKLTQVKFHDLSPAKEYQPPADLRNPFEDAPPPVPKEEAVNEKAPPKIWVSLNGILWDPDRPMASVNGRVLPEGGRLGEVSVLRIFPDRVVLDVGGRRVEKVLQEKK
jgi:hypothetical protein